MDKKEKTFTQEEVNEIVKAALRRQRGWSYRIIKMAPGILKRVMIAYRALEDFADELDAFIKEYPYDLPKSNH